MDILRQYQLDLMLVMSGIGGTLAMLVYLTEVMSQKRKVALLLVELGATFLVIADRRAYIYRGDTSDLGWWMVRMSNFAVFLGNHLILICAATFIIRTTARDGVVTGKPLVRIFYAIIFTGIALLILSRIFGFYYAFDDQNRYYRLNSYWIMVILLWTAAVLLLIVTIANWGDLSRIERVSFVMLEVLPIVAIVAQLFTYGISLTSFASTVSLAMLFIAYILGCSEEIVSHERKMLLEIIAALTEAVDAKDAYTRGHSSRVAKYSRAIAERMGMEQDEAERIYRMALLHDVGKIGVPDAGLNKPGKLTSGEYSVIQSHAALGGDILAKVESMPDLAEGARWHHERIDGHGYPDGLRGDEIPLEARIICVADCYDAMTSNRVYRQHLPQEVVRREIENNAGTQFDKDVAAAMLELIDEDKEYRLRE